jgi:hypothetical protein
MSVFDEIAKRPMFWGLDDEGRPFPLAGAKEYIAYIEKLGGENALWYSSKRWVGDTIIGRCRVSTVFLVVDHGFMGPPMLFETMVFPNVGGDAMRDAARKARREQLRATTKALQESPSGRLPEAPLADEYDRLEATSPLDGYMRRYSTLQEAVAGHDIAVKYATRWVRRRYKFTPPIWRDTDLPK